MPYFLTGTSWSLHIKKKTTTKRVELIFVDARKERKIIRPKQQWLDKHRYKFVCSGVFFFLGEE